MSTVIDRLKMTVRDSAIYTLPSIASQLVGIVLVPVYTRVFTPADYGVMSGVNLVVPIAAMLLMAGIESGVARYYLDSKDENDKKNTAATSLFFVAAFSSLVILVVLLFFSSQLAELVLKDGSYATYFILALAKTPFSLCYKLGLDILRFRFQAFRRTIISIANMLVDVSLIIYFVVSLRMGITGVFLATLITAICFCFATIYMVRKHYAFTFSIMRLKELLSYSLPLVPSAMIMYVFNYADRYFLINMTNLEELGLYSIGMTVASVVLFLTGGIQIAWIPTVLSSFRDENAKQFFSKAFDYLVAFIFLAAVGISLFSQEILTVFTTEKYLPAYSVVSILVLAVIFQNAITLFSFGISIAKKTHYYIWLTIIPLIINVGLNYLLIPQYGKIGAAMATLASSFIYGAASFIISQRLYHVDYRLAPFFKILAVVTVLIAIGYFFFPDVSLANILIKIGLVLVYIACTYCFNLFGKEELQYLLKFIHNKIFRRQS